VVSNCSSMGPWHVGQLGEWKKEADWWDQTV
jgi:hypothetical protein